MGGEVSAAQFGHAVVYAKVFECILKRVIIKVESNFIVVSNVLRFI